MEVSGEVACERNVEKCVRWWSMGTSVECGVASLSMSAKQSFGKMMMMVMVCLNYELGVFDDIMVSYMCL